MKSNTNTPNLTESQKQSAYFNIGDDYDKDFYENDLQNWIKIIGMFIIFYIFNAFHWWANLELSLANPAGATTYNLIMFGVSVITIGVMLIFGGRVNKLKITHEFYTEKISEEKQKKAEIQAKAAAKAANAQRLAAI